MDTITLVVPSVVLLFLIGVLIKEILTALEIMSTFKCNICGNRVKKIVNLKTMCTHCGRGEGKIEEHTFKHFFTHRVNSIKAEPKNWSHEYKSYIRFSKIEIWITSFCILIFVLYILEMLLRA